MRFIRKTLILLYIVACVLQVTANDGLTSGLYFKSFKVNKDMRTSLNLTPDRALNLKNGFVLEFELSLRWETHNFGYIFRLISDDALNIDLLADLSSSETNFSLVVGRQTLIRFRNSEIGFEPQTWIRTWLRCDPLKNEITVSFNGIEKTAKFDFGSLKNVEMYFGGNNHSLFATTDIAPMTVREIRISDIELRPLRYWKLKRHANNAVFDEYKGAKAVISNQQWEINKHAKWNKIKKLELDAAQYYIAFDHINDRIFIVGNKQILIYHPKNQTINTLKVKHGQPFNTENNNQLVYCPTNDELISYNFESNNLAKFNFDKLEWSNDDDALIPVRYGHHSKFYSHCDSLLITFGGYGFHRYNSTLHRYIFESGTWENFDFSSVIAPRYLGSMGYIDDRKLLYFGGFGNESGRQEESPRNFYDLYSIDIDAAKAEKIWELAKNPEEHFTKSNSLVVDKENRKFYALAYSNKRFASIIKLHEYCMDKPNYRIVGDTIPYFFSDINSYCNLFKSSDSSELYAVTLYAGNETTQVNIYSISFPALNQKDILQPIPANTKIRRLLLILATTLFFLFYYMYIKFFKKENYNADEQVSDNEEEIIIYEKPEDIKFKHSSIGLLGDFRIINSSGKDIAGKLSPSTVQLFLLILISTIKNGKGISSHELKKTLWFDKDDESARNNRNVYFNRLRKVLNLICSVDDVKIVKKEGNWAVEFQEHIFCDYKKAMQLIDTLKTGERGNKNIVTELVEISLNGMLLHNIQQSEWLDLFQSEYTNQLIECLIECINHKEIKTDYLLQLKIADAILLHDNIDEDAISLKCRALFNMGRKNQALHVFNKFTTEYEKLLVDKHNLVFEEIVKQT